MFVSTWSRARGSGSGRQGRGEGAKPKSVVCELGGALTGIHAHCRKLAPCITGLRTAPMHSSAHRPSPNTQRPSHCLWQSALTSWCSAARARRTPYPRSPISPSGLLHKHNKLNAVHKTYSSSLTEGAGGDTQEPRRCDNTRGDRHHHSSTFPRQLVRLAKRSPARATRHHHRLRSPWLASLATKMP